MAFSSANREELQTGKTERRLGEINEKTARETESDCRKFMIRAVHQVGVDKSRLSLLQS